MFRKVFLEALSTADRGSRRECERKVGDGVYTRGLNARHEVVLLVIASHWRLCWIDLEKISSTPTKSNKDMIKRYKPL